MEERVNLSTRLGLIFGVACISGLSAYIALDSTIVDQDLKSYNRARHTQTSIQQLPKATVCETFKKVDGITHGYNCNLTTNADISQLTKAYIDEQKNDENIQKYGPIFLTAIAFAFGGLIGNGICLDINYRRRKRNSALKQKTLTI